LNKGEGSFLKKKREGGKEGGREEGREGRREGGRAYLASTR
jgi:hypothetical protein